MKKQITRFILVGITAVTIDFSAYYVLTTIWAPGISKALAFLLGAMVAFVLNKYFTFEQVSKSKTELLKFIILYLTTLFLNVSTNALALQYLPLLITSAQVVKLLAVLCATGLSTILNFIGQKFWVFNRE